MNMQPITDELLSAYLDDELEAGQQQTVDAWLQNHPEDRTRLLAWQADRAALAALFNPVLEEPAPARLRDAVWRRQGTPRWAMAAAAAGLLLAGGVLGGAGAWQWQSKAHAAQLAQARQPVAAGSAQGWVQRAAFAHSIYTNEPRHAVEVGAQEEHLARWLTRRVDVPVKLYNLRSFGFELVGGRLLPDGAGKSAQLMYQDAQQRRVTIYLRKPEQGADPAFRFEQQGKLSMFYWVEEEAGYALVGDLPRDTLLAMAKFICDEEPGHSAPATPTR